MSKKVNQSVRRPDSQTVRQSNRTETTQSDSPTVRQSDTAANTATPLPDWQIQTIDLFVRAADLLGIPKSVGLVYGLLFSTEAPLPLDAIKDRLQISKGSTSQALQFLKRIQAVKPIFIHGDRRDHFEPELEMKKLIGGFLRDQVQPHLESGDTRLKSIQNQNGEVPAIIKKRLNRMAGWRKRADQLLPLIVTVLGGKK